MKETFILTQSSGARDAQHLLGFRVLYCFNSRYEIDYMKPCFIVPAKNPVLREVHQLSEPWQSSDRELQLIGNNIQIDLIIGKYIFLRKGEPANPERKLS